MWLHNPLLWPHNLCHVFHQQAVAQALAQGSQELAVVMQHRQLAEDTPLLLQQVIWLNQQSVVDMRRRSHDQLWAHILVHFRPCHSQLVVLAINVVRL